MKAAQMNRIDLGGKVALVNGASRGIGEAIARGLAACGARVILSSRDRDSVQLVADSITADGGEATARACHAGRLEDIDALFDSITSDFGRLDILINCAATNPWFGPAADLPPAAFDKTVEVNLKGPYYMMSRAVPLMIAGGGGSIVNVASIAALVAMSGQAVYAMTKAGLVSLTPVSIWWPVSVAPAIWWRSSASSTHRRRRCRGRACRHLWGCWVSPSSPPG